MAVIGAVLIASSVLALGGGSDSTSAARNVVSYEDFDKLVAEAESREANKRESSRESRLNLGDLVISGISGQSPSEHLLKTLKNGEVAGVIIMGENVDTMEELKSLTSSIATAAASGGQNPPLVMVDQEGGEVKRFLSAAPNLSPAAMAKKGKKFVRSTGAQTGEDLRERGANVNLAPVADVVSTSGNFLGTRVFGTNPSRAGSLACAFADGLRDGNVASTLKHFPGLGSAGSVNTDNGAVTISATRSSLASAWTAYHRCAAGELSLVMVSSAVYPAAYGSAPALFEKSVYKDLRNTVGFNGPVITDALNADALQGFDGVGTRALAAGADLLLYMDEESAAMGLREIKDSLNSGTLSSADLRRKAERVSMLRRQLGD